MLLPAILIYLLPLLLLVLGVRAYRRTHNRWKLYAIPIYLNICFYAFFFAPMFLGGYSMNRSEMLKYVYTCLFTMALTTVVWWGLIQSLRGAGWIYNRLRR